MAFLRVAERRSFRAAAPELGISPPALSQIIQKLEARVGAPLLSRTTRRVGLTEAGRRFLTLARPAVDSLMSAFDQAQTLGAQIKGLLRINVPRPMVPFLADGFVRDFCDEYPEVELEIFAEDRLVDIVEEEFDAGIRLRELIDTDMIAVRLSPPFDYLVVGSPKYLSRHGRPKRPEDLREHRCIRSRRSSRAAIYRWEFLQNKREYAVSVSGPLIVNDPALNVSSAALGLGLAYTAAPIAMPFIERGELETVLKEFCPSSPGVFLYYPSRAQALPKLRAFIEFARKRFAQGHLGAPATAAPTCR